MCVHPHRPEARIECAYQRISVHSIARARARSHSFVRSVVRSVGRLLCSRFRASVLVNDTQRGTQTERMCECVCASPRCLTLDVILVVVVVVVVVANAMLERGKERERERDIQRERTKTQYSPAERHTSCGGGGHWMATRTPPERTSN